MSDLLSELTQAAQIESCYQRDLTEAQTEHNQRKARLTGERNYKYEQMGFDSLTLIDSIDELAGQPKTLQTLLESPDAQKTLVMLQNRFKQCDPTLKSDDHKQKLNAILFLGGEKVSNIEDDLGYNFMHDIDDLPEPLREVVLAKMQTNITAILNGKKVDHFEKERYQQLTYAQSPSPSLKAKAIALVLGSVEESNYLNLNNSIAKEIIALHQAPDLTNKDKETIYYPLRRIFAQIDDDIDQTPTIRIMATDKPTERINYTKLLLLDLAEPVRKEQPNHSAALMENVAVPAALLKAKALMKDSTPQRVEEGKKLLKKTVRNHAKEVEKLHNQGQISNSFYNNKIQSARRFGSLGRIKGLLKRTGESIPKGIDDQDLS